ncbi:thiamine phosphate synthase [uncultured Methanoregula sp.]|uniref:thiamine phosphate synthase n=1 Tax=uncultured Methanoregula sp. TaxID=1005933 RepID=UPI002AABB627|nr:thiamine phosphate synthase [uncultured Methanoregula sp.]
MKFNLYVITDEMIAHGRAHAAIAQLAVLGGADVIQLRDKNRGCLELTRIGREIRKITRTAGAGFIVNDRLDVALACGADGVHLGQGDLTPAIVRQLAPPGFIIGVSVGNGKEACLAEKEGADYVALSPTFSTDSKPDAGPGHGCGMLAEIAGSVSIPVIAIGGIGRENIPEVIRAGAAGIAVISAVVAQPDITAAARELAALVASEKRKLAV